MVDCGVFISAAFLLSVQITTMPFFYATATYIIWINQQRKTCCVERFGSHCKRKNKESNLCIMLIPQFEFVFGILVFGFCFTFANSKFHLRKCKRWKPLILMPRIEILLNNPLKSYRIAEEKWYGNELSWTY